MLRMHDLRSTGLRVRDLSKSYGAVRAARGVSLEANAGDVLGLLGPNGAGKTTVLECILGVRRPDAGTVEVCGIDALADGRRARSRIGAQLQNAFLQDKITPREALAFFGSFYSSPVLPEELLATFGLAEKSADPFDSLSGGQRQRLFLALALVNNPPLVVLDEPTAGLDPAARRDLHQLIGGFRSAGRTVLLSTHLVEDARVLCDRVAILVDGCVAACGTPSELVARATSTASVVVRSERPIDPSEGTRLDAVSSCRLEGDTLRLGTRDAPATITALMRHLDASANSLMDLQVHRPSLEDAYLEIVGSPAERGSR